LLFPDWAATRFVRGNERYLGSVLGNAISRLPIGLFRIINRFLERIPDSGEGRLNIERAKRFFSAADLSPAERYVAFLTVFNRNDRARLFSNDLLNDIHLESPEQYAASFFRPFVRNGDYINAMLCVDFNIWLPDNLLTLTDRMSMAHSLEVRVPLLDNRLIDFFSALPANLKLRNTQKKYLLKKAAARVLPPAVVNRRKQGFSIPLPVWFRSELRDYVYEVLAPRELSDLDYLIPKRSKRS